MKALNTNFHFPEAHTNEEDESFSKVDAYMNYHYNKG